MIGHIRQTERQQMSLYPRKTRSTIARLPSSMLASEKSLTKEVLKKGDRTTRGGKVKRWGDGGKVGDKEIKQ